MTLSATIPTRHNFTGNDIATEFSYTLKIGAKTHITVVHTNAAGIEDALGVLAVDVDYTVNGVLDAGGGSVDFPIGGSAYSTLATGEKLSIIYSFPIEQELDLPDVGRVFNESVEDQFDYMTVLINQSQEKLDRSIKLTTGSTLTDITLPEGASKLFAWNAALTALELVSIGTVTAVDPIAVKGDIVQGDTAGNAAKLAIGGTGALLQVESGLLEYLSVGATSAVYQVVAGKIASVTNPIFLLPTVADLTNMTHDHADAAGGGDLGAVQATDLTLTGSAAATPDANTLTKDHMIGARCTFDGTGTPAFDENIGFNATITDNGPGNYTLTFLTNFANADYTSVGSAEDDNFTSFKTNGVGNITVEVYDDAGTQADVSRISIVLIGAQ